MGSKQWEKVVDKDALVAAALQLSAFDGGTRRCSRTELNRSAFVLDNVLSPDECESLIQQSEQQGYSFWDSVSQQPETDFRSAYTIEVIHEELADVLWVMFAVVGDLQKCHSPPQNRVKDEVDKDVVIGSEEEDSRWECELEGRWEACGINSNLLFARYTAGGHFGPHTDGTTIKDLNYRSLYPVIAYLNEPEEGGETVLLNDQQKRKKIEKDACGRYHCDEELVIARVKAKTGRVLCFYHTQMHEGVAVTGESKKYIIRTDVMYKRKPPILTSPVDREAYQLWMEAQRKAENGEADEATMLFRRCFKLSEGLRQLLSM